MTDRRLLTITSLASIALFSLHWADEITRGIELGTIADTWGGLAILFAWLFATLVLANRRWGLVLVLLGAILAATVPVLHMQGAGLVGGRIPVNSPGAFFWVWTNIALGVSGLMSIPLAIAALWRTNRS